MISVNNGKYGRSITFSVWLLLKYDVTFEQMVFIPSRCFAFRKKIVSNRWALRSFDILHQLHYAGVCVRMKCIRNFKATHEITRLNMGFWRLDRILIAEIKTPFDNQVGGSLELNRTLGNTTKMNKRAPRIPALVGVRTHTLTIGLRKWARGRV